MSRHSFEHARPVEKDVFVSAHETSSLRTHLLGHVSDDILDSVVWRFCPPRRLFLNMSDTGWIHSRLFWTSLKWGELFVSRISQMISICPRVFLKPLFQMVLDFCRMGHHCNDRTNPISEALENSAPTSVRYLFQICRKSRCL